MKLDKDTKILIVGLGLLGGSYAKALTKKGFTVTAITRSQSSVDYALSEGMITEGRAEPDPGLIGRADLIVFALYPHVFVEWIENYGKYIKPGTVITDVTGVFNDGDVIEVRATDGSVIMKAITGFNSSDLLRIMGRKTKDIARILGNVPKVVFRPEDSVYL